MGIENYEQSAKYRQRLAADLKLFFPDISQPDEQALGRLGREALDAAYAARRTELHRRFAGQPKDLEVGLGRLTNGYDDLRGFLDQREAHIHRTGVDPLRSESNGAPTSYKSVFLQNRGRAQIIAVGGGKGGIGKSMLSANLAIALATLGRQVVAVDMDLGGADLHLLLGLRTLPRSLNDFIDRKCDSIDDVRLTTAYKNLTVIATDSSRLGVANIKYAHKEKILRHLAKIDCDVIIVDLGAEVSFNVLDVFLAADHRYIVTSPEPASVLESYGLVKLSLFRKIRHFAGEMVPKSSEVGRVVDNFLFEKTPSENGVPKTMWELVNYLGENDPDLQKQLLRILYQYSTDLVINMSESEGDRSIAVTMTRLCQDHLAINLRQTHLVPRDKKVRDASRKLLPVGIYAPTSPAARALFDIAALMTPHKTDAAQMSKQVSQTADTVIGRVQKMREMSALASPGQPVNQLIPVEEEKETVGKRIKTFLSKEVHLSR